MIPWLAPGQAFPPVRAALAHPNGLLAASRDLAVERLVDAYRHGIFPWYSEGEPVLWWSPDPRMVLFTDEFRVSRTFGKTLPVREERAGQVKAADEALGQVVAALRKRGINHPYVKNYVLARTTPLNRQRKTVPSFDQAFSKLIENVESFDIAAVKYDEIRRAANFAAAATSE